MLSSMSVTTVKADFKCFIFCCANYSYLTYCFLDLENDLYWLSRKLLELTTLKFTQKLVLSITSSPQISSSATSNQLQIVTLWNSLLFEPQFLDNHSIDFIAMESGKRDSNALFYIEPCTLHQLGFLLLCPKVVAIVVAKWTNAIAFLYPQQISAI